MKSIFKYVKDLKTIYEQLLEIMDGKQKRESIMVLISMILVSLVELLGVSSIFPFLELVVSRGDIDNKFVTRFIKGFFPGLGMNGVILVLGIIISAIFIFKNLVSLYFTYLQNKFAAKFQKEISVLMLDSYMKQDYEFFVNTNSAVLQRGINTDSSAVYTVLLSSFQMVGEIITIILIGSYLIAIDYFVALSSLGLAAFAALLIVLLFKNRIKDAANVNRFATKERNKFSYQAFFGIKEITVLRRRNFFVEKYNEASEKLAEGTLVYGFLAACPDRVLEAICMSGFMMIICVRILAGVDVDTFIPVLGTFAMGVFKVLPSISKISNRINAIIYSRPGLESCHQNVISARALEEDRNANKVLVVGDQKLDFENKVSISDVCWKYTNSQENTIEDLSLEIKKGEAVALIGASGAGKTTLVDIILGLLVPQKGTIKVDEYNLSQAGSAFNKLVGYVPQNVFLTDDTVRANIAFGITDEEIQDDKIWAALEKAQLKSFVESLPDKLDTIVGERGVKFSGGQRQRVAIARALYEDPEIMVLDEATAALDSNTENAVMEAIDDLRGKKTLIIVAHRMTTIRNCDSVYEIKDGKAIKRDLQEVLSEQ